MTRAALALAAMLAAAAPALAVPLLPREIRVVPVYDKSLGIRLSWIERGGIDYYDILRSVDGGAESALATVGGGAANNPVTYLDAPVVATSRYTYRIEVHDATGFVGSPFFTTSPKVLWPIAGGREVMNGYNEVIGWAGKGAEVRIVDPGPPVKTEAVAAGYHMGVDLNKTTPIVVPDGDVVVAPRGGIVNDVRITGVDLDNGAIGIKVDVGNNRFEYDTFNHIATTGPNAPPVARDDVVAPGQPIAHIGTLNAFVGNFAKHVHFMQERFPIPAGQQRIIRHPLDVFTDPADRDPLGKAPALFDENQDGKVVLYRDHATHNLIDYDLAKTPLHGDVDVEPEVVDEQGTDPGEAPIDLGYWIEGPLPDTAQLDDVKSAAHPYRLYDFRVEYFGGIPGTSPPAPCNLVSDIADLANPGCGGLTDCTTPPSVACSSVIKEGATAWPFPVLHHFIVTHAGGEKGARADVDPNQFWRTAAVDDGTPVAGIDANFHDRAVTIKATEARFPDGDYTIHVVASDLVHSNVDLKLPVARLENFAPFVQEVLVGIDGDGSAGSGQPGLPGCELLVYHFKHTHRQAYPRPQDVVLSKVATTLVRSGQRLCVQLRFSEPMTSAAVDLARDRGTGIVIPGSAFSGALSKTYQSDDTWTGSLVLPADQSGASDASPVSDEHDVALRIIARDRRNAAGAMRLLDTNSSGVPDPGGDLTHVVARLDLSVPTATLDVIKP